jgi:2-polyprenyl-3-methyl-5-hydroxy-6-metoxy-1,4-benzoquinol methylase
VHVSSQFEKIRRTKVSKRPSIAVDQATTAGGPVTRFAFGKNWQRFLRYLDEQRIAGAEKSLCDMLELDSLNGKSFLDVGSGSGLFSLAAMRLGARSVHSFDYDSQSVACASELKHRYFRQAGNWTIEQGSILDPAYFSRLGQFEVVYSWGVLHHTGDMWQALENITMTVALKGKLFIALYNDQGFSSRFWRVVKQRYSRGFIYRLPIIAVFGAYFAIQSFVVDIAILRRNPLIRYREHEQSRGMSYFTDLLDWVGGYPFEVAKPEAVFDFFREKGFELVRLKTVGGHHGNNEFVFIKCRELNDR